jgi:hypothetical protein
LLGCELPLAAELHAALLGDDAPGTGALSDQRSLELGSP